MSTSNLDQSKLASIKTYMLIAFIFGLIATILFLIAGIVYLIGIGAAYSAIQPLSYYTSVYGSSYGTLYYNAAMQSINAAIAGAIVGGIAFLVIGGVGVYIFFAKIRKMYNASKTGDVAKLKALNSMLWAILALIFTGVLPGIMMIISFGPINELGQAQAPPPPPPS